MRSVAKSELDGETRAAGRRDQLTPPVFTITSRNFQVLFHAALQRSWYGETGESRHDV